MNKLKHFSACLYMAFLLVFTSAAAKELPKAPNPPKLVNDFAGVLSAQEVQLLESKLTSFYDSTTNQIAIIIERTIEDEEIADYARRIGEAWGIRGEKRRNGVIVFAAIDDRKMTIQVGYDLEPVITDAATFHIRNEQLAPNFRAGNYYRGLDEATDVLMGLANKEFSADQLTKGDKKPGKKGISTGQIIFIVILIIIILNIIRKSGGNRRRRGGWGSFTGGVGPFFGGGFGGGGFGGGGGGFGGGGFGGFGGGGGGFGGGGSSGSW